MKLCKRSIIISSLLAVLAISSAYRACPSTANRNTDTAVVDMDYSNIPELKKSIEELQHRATVNLLLLLQGNLQDKITSIRLVSCLTGNRVVSRKSTYKTKKNQERAILKGA